FSLLSSDSNSFMFRWSCSDGPELIHELEMTKVALEFRFLDVWINSLASCSITVQVVNYISTYISYISVDYISVDYISCSTTSRSYYASSRSFFRMDLLDRGQLMIKYKCACIFLCFFDIFQTFLTSLTINFTNYCNYLMHFVKIFFTNYCNYLMHFSMPTFIGVKISPNINVSALFNRNHLVLFFTSWFLTFLCHILS
ncbi:hypothetical protein ACJX0J_041535, partial [Zea mays]